MAPKKFDGAAYLQQNPDVAASSWAGSPEVHYYQHGRREGRAAPYVSADETNYDQREVKKYTPNPGLLASFENVRDDGEGNLYDAYNNRVDDRAGYEAFKNQTVLDKIFTQGTDNAGQRLAYGALDANAGDGYSSSREFRDYYTNKELFDKKKQDRLSQYTSKLGIPAGDAEQLQNILFPYSQNVDYRQDTAEDFYSPDSVGGRRLISDDPQKQSALDYLYKFQDANRTSRRKSFQGATLAGILAFVTAGAASALAAPAAAASGTAGGVAAGGTGGAVAGAGGAAGAAGAAGGGGFFVGSGGILGNTGSFLANTVANGAIQGGIQSAITGGNPLRGAIAGGVGAGFASALPDVGALVTDNPTFRNAINSGVSGAIRGGVNAGLNGGNIGQGVIAGGVSSAAGSAARGLVGDALPTDIPGRNAITNLAGGAVSGAVGSAISGGDIGRGAVRGGASGGVSGAALDLGFGSSIADFAGSVAGQAIGGSNQLPVTQPVIRPINQSNGQSSAPRGGLLFARNAPVYRDASARNVQWGQRG